MSRTSLEHEYYPTNKDNFANRLDRGEISANYDTEIKELENKLALLKADRKEYSTKEVILSDVKSLFGFVIKNGDCDESYDKLQKTIERLVVRFESLH
jgi:hypothetical protein